MTRMKAKKKFLITALVAGVMFLMSSCGATNGWDALPVDNPAGCYQITEWHKDGSGHTKTSALGVFCPQEEK